MNSQRMSVGEAVVRFLDNQYVSFDGKENKFVEGIFTIFGHGCVNGKTLIESISRQKRARYGAGCDCIRKAEQQT